MLPDSNSEIASLRRQIFLQLLALVVLAGSVTVYLYRQASIEGKQLTQAKRVIAGYEAQEPNFINVLNELVAYGQSHPDFSKTVLKKYGIATSPINPGAATTSK
jgi:hypothetical protein